MKHSKTEIALLTISVVFVVVMLIVPLVSVLTNSLAEGWDFYVQALTTPYVLSALRLTLIATVAAVIVNTIVGLGAAWAISKFDFRGKHFLTTLIDIPFSISPVIAGLAFIMTFGRMGWIGQWIEVLNDYWGTDIQIVFAVPGVILATIFVTFPFVFREIIPVLSTNGRDEEEAAALMGASGWTIFFRITLPQIKWALLYGIVLCTARALGEFGAVSALSKLRGETFTLPLEIDALYQSGSADAITAAFAVSSPNQLSGGQRQRVAFARALAPNPQVLLLDEPFAAIDAKVRQELRNWLKDTIHRVGITSIFVTHDQDEAVEVADEIIITNHGHIEQVGTPLDIYRQPRTPFVAQFIGTPVVIDNCNILTGFLQVGAGKQAIVRPEFLKIYKHGTMKQYISAAEEGTVEAVVFRGSHLDVTVRIKGLAIHGEYSFDDPPLSVGETVQVLIYRLYVLDGDKTYLKENSAMTSADVFYI